MSLNCQNPLKNEGLTGFQKCAILGSGKGNLWKNPTVKTENDMASKVLERMDMDALAELAKIQPTKEELEWLTKNLTDERKFLKRNIEKEKLEKLFKEKPHISKKEFNKLKGGDWVAVKWLDAPDCVALILDPFVKGYLVKERVFVSLLIFNKSPYLEDIDYTQIMRKLGSVEVPTL